MGKLSQDIVVSFLTDHFLHLTEVESKLSAKEFYKNAKREKLQIINFTSRADICMRMQRKKLAYKPSNEVEMLAIKLRMLESDVRDLKQRVL